MPEYQVQQMTKEKCPECGEMKPKDGFMNGVCFDCDEIHVIRSVLDNAQIRLPKEPDEEDRD